MKFSPSSGPNSDPHRNWPHDLKLPSSNPPRSLDDLMANAEHYAEATTNYSGRNGGEQVENEGCEDFCILYGTPNHSSGSLEACRNPKRYKVAGSAASRSRRFRS